MGKGEKVTDNLKYHDHKTENLTQNTFYAPTHIETKIHEKPHLGFTGSGPNLHMGGCMQPNMMAPGSMNYGMHPQMMGNVPMMAPNMMHQSGMHGAMMHPQQMMHQSGMHGSMMHPQQMMHQSGCHQPMMATQPVHSHNHMHQNQHVAGPVSVHQTITTHVERAVEVERPIHYQTVERHVQPQIIERPVVVEKPYPVEHVQQQYINVPHIVEKHYTNEKHILVEKPVVYDNYTVKKEMPTHIVGERVTGTHAGPMMNT